MELKSSLGPLEQRVMGKVWGLYDKQPLMVRQVFEAVRDEHRIAYNTVLTVMIRLVEKGFLNRVKSGKAHKFVPMVSQRKTLKSIVGRMMQTMVDQFGTEALTAFADEIEKLTIEEKKMFVKKLKDY